MSILTRTLTSLLALTTIAGTIAPRVEAAPVTGNHEDHVILWNTIREAGVRTYINPKQCFEEDFKNTDGFYISNGKGILVVCQDNMKKPGIEVAWTANDYDTLRHEVVHLIQDCRDGRGDNSLIPILEFDELKGFVSRVLTPEQVERIIKSYRKRGVSDEQIINELEAFAIARVVNASEIAEGVEQYCMS